MQRACLFPAIKVQLFYKSGAYKHGDISSVLSFSCCLISSELETRNNTVVHSHLNFTPG